MWAVLKINTKEINLLKEDLKRKLNSDFNIYAPKISFNVLKKNKLNNKESYLLGDYVFCFSKKFNDLKYINQIRFSKGLKHVMRELKLSQFEISKFIQNCKKHEIRDGIVSPDFFELVEKIKYEFKSGPFSQKIFEVLNINKTKINLLMGHLKISLEKKKYIFSPQ